MVDSYVPVVNHNVCVDPAAVVEEKDYVPTVLTVEELLIAHRCVLLAAEKQQVVDDGD